MDDLRTIKAELDRLKALTDALADRFGSGLDDRRQLVLLLLDNAWLMLADTAVDHAGEHPAEAITRRRLVQALRLQKQAMQTHLAEDPRVAGLFA